VTSGEGAYRFRTIKPVPYPGRAPHIHFAITALGGGRLVTQMYVAGAPENARDGILNSIRDERQRARLLVAFEPAPQIEPGGLAARFDIVLARDPRFAPG
jgi:protocatechuate 3,4-dioxygenase beta subunit